MSNLIVTENQNAGTSAWIPDGHTGLPWIAGYANATSVAPGGSLTLSISTQVNATLYSISVYRMGYYGGQGARLMQTISGQTGAAQGYYDPVGNVLNNCSTTFTDVTTGLLEPRWASSYTLAIPSNWTTGVYLVQLRDASLNNSYIPFVVTSPSVTDYAVVFPFQTDQAYNQWGGKSLYGFNSTSGVAATKVSFDRPYANVDGTGQVLTGAIHLIKWMESQGYNLSYFSDVDIHTNPTQLQSYKAYISVGHDEYWTLEQRNGVEAAISSGVGAAFMGANSCYWQMRLESGGQNGANRTAVCYRSTATDPLFGVDTTRVTVNWRSTPLNRPESTMIGIMYSHVTNGSSVAWTVDSGATSHYLATTGLVVGQSYGSDLVGNECDKRQTGSPSNLQIIGTSTYTTDSSTSDISHTTTYVATSNALVFAAGAIFWALCLDPYRYAAPSVPAVPGMQAMLANIVSGLRQNKSSKAFTSAIHL